MAYEGQLIPISIQVLAMVTAYGTTPWELFSGSETGLLAASLSETAQMDAEGNRVSAYQFAISDISETSSFDRWQNLLERTLLQWRLPEQKRLLLWLQLPTIDQARAQWLNAHYAQVLLGVMGVLDRFVEVRYCNEEPGLLHAWVSLQQRNDIDGIVFLAVDTLLGSETQQERALNETLLTEENTEAAAAGEAGVCLYLTRDTHNTLMRLQHHYTDMAQVPTSIWSQVRHLVTLSAPTRAAVDQCYQWNQTYSAVPFGTNYQASGIHLLYAPTRLGDVGTASMALMYCYAIGAASQEKNTWLIHQNHIDTQTIILLTPFTEENHHDH